MGIRMGVIGPAEGADAELGAALQMLMADDDMRQVLYLGLDDAAKRHVAELAGENLRPDSFLRRSVELAREGTPEAIEALLQDDRAAADLTRVRVLPEPPARAVEMLERWIVLGVHDKSVLDEDDIANAHIILYGKSSEAYLKRFGPRCFFTPGPLAQRQVGRLELLNDGGMRIELLDLDGKVQRSEEVGAPHGKFVVTT